MKADATTHEVRFKLLHSLRELLIITASGVPMALAAAFMCGAPVVYVLHRLGVLRATTVPICCRGSEASGCGLPEVPPLPHSDRIHRAAPQPVARGLLALATLLAAGCASVHFNEARLFRPRPCPGSEPQRGGVAGAFTVRPLSIRNADGGGQLEAVVLAQDHPRGVLLFFGGNEVRHRVASYVADTTVTSGRSFLVEAARLELTFVFVNYRGYGASEGTPGLMVGRQDALSVYDELQRNPAFAGLPVLVQGQSIGVTFAAHVATERPVRGLILESPPTTFREVIRGVTPWYMRPFLHVEVSDALIAEDNRRAVAPVAAPLLVVVGDQDRVTPPAMASRVLRAASSSSKELRIVLGAAHGNLVRFSAYWDAIDAFSRRVIPAHR